MPAQTLDLGRALNSCGASESENPRRRPRGRVQESDKREEHGQTVDVGEQPTSAHSAGLSGPRWLSGFIIIIIITINILWLIIVIIKLTITNLINIIMNHNSNTYYYYYYH